MSRRRLRQQNTDLGNLISNLRGEVGEIVFTWVLMRSFMADVSRLRPDIDQAFTNPQVTVLDALIEKLSDEIVGRLSELAEPKIGRLTFHFACVKLNCLQDAAKGFSSFIERHRFRGKRNYDISHKELPEQWSDHRYIYIPYGTVVKGVAAALRLMKAIDVAYLGPRARYLWRELRRRRYSLAFPARFSYMLLPHLWLSPEDRAGIIREEMQVGRAVWTDARITINGEEVSVKTYGELGAVVLGGQVLLLPQPFTELKSIDCSSRGEGSAASKTPADTG